MASQIQQFITRTNQMIKDDGLTGISGISFIKGHKNYGTPMDVLKSKSYEGIAYGLVDKPYSLSAVAADMNQMNDCIDALCGYPLMKKRVSGKLIPKGAGIPMKMYTDEFGDEIEQDGFLDHERTLERKPISSFFNDSQKIK